MLTCVDTDFVTNSNYFLNADIYGFSHDDTFVHICSLFLGGCACGHFGKYYCNIVVIVRCATISGITELLIKWGFGCGRANAHRAVRPDRPAVLCRDGQMRSAPSRYRVGEILVGERLHVDDWERD